MASTLVDRQYFVRQEVKNDALMLQESGQFLTNPSYTGRQTASPNDVTSETGSEYTEKSCRSSIRTSFLATNGDSLSDSRPLSSSSVSSSDSVNNSNGLPGSLNQSGSDGEQGDAPQRSGKKRSLFTIEYILGRANSKQGRHSNARRTSPLSDELPAKVKRLMDFNAGRQHENLNTGTSASQSPVGTEDFAAENIPSAAWLRQVYLQKYYQRMSPANFPAAYPTGVPMAPTCWFGLPASSLGSNVTGRWHSSSAAWTSPLALPPASNYLTPITNNQLSCAYNNCSHQTPLCSQVSEKSSPVLASTDASCEVKSKRNRTVFTADQLQCLEHEFNKQRYMVGTERYYLAQKLNLNEAQVKVWFQNRRIKWRKQKNQTTEECSSDSKTDGDKPSNFDLLREQAINDDYR